MRLDVYLAENSIAKSRTYAKILISGGQVYINGVAVTKPSHIVLETDRVEIKGETLRYVSRGGLKLERALEVFPADVSGKVCLDIGASSGGFTDCMLQNNAKLVYAVDTGTGQLASKLLADEKVIGMERTNILDLDLLDFREKPQFIAVDVSFVSVTRILPKIKELLPDDGNAVILIKPQFEAGREHIGKSGVVKDKKAHVRVLSDISSALAGAGLAMPDLISSPVRGGGGNIEYLGFIGHFQGETVRFNFEAVVNNAFNALMG